MSDIYPFFILDSYMYTWLTYMYTSACIHSYVYVYMCAQLCFVLIIYLECMQRVYLKQSILEGVAQFKLERFSYESRPDLEISVVHRDPFVRSCLLK